MQENNLENHFLPSLRSFINHMNEEVVRNSETERGSFTLRELKKMNIIEVKKESMAKIKHFVEYSKLAYPDDTARVAAAKISIKPYEFLCDEEIFLLQEGRPILDSGVMRFEKESIDDVTIYLYFKIIETKNDDYGTIFQVERYTNGPGGFMFEYGATCVAADYYMGSFKCTKSSVKLGALKSYDHEIQKGCILTSFVMYGLVLRYIAFLRATAEVSYIEQAPKERKEHTSSNPKTSSGKSSTQDVRRNVSLGGDIIIRSYDKNIKRKLRHFQGYSHSFSVTGHIRHIKQKDGTVKIVHVRPFVKGKGKEPGIGKRYIPSDDTCVS